MKRIRIILFLLFCLLGGSIYAQNSKTITGKVIDENELPLPGVNILIKGTTKGTISDFKGEFSLTVENDTKTLVLTYIGYRLQEQSIVGISQLNVQLEQDQEQLEEVVVVGYGSVKKSDLTGSVSSVKSDELLQNSPTSLGQALQGRAAGVQVRTNSAAPGGGVSVTVRGGNSVNSSTEPLYVVDGIPLEGNLTSIPPDDIESIEILKDASSTAIYGSRGANGVVLITTKRGKEGKPTVTYSNFFKIEEKPSNLDILNAEEFTMIHNEWSRNTGTSPIYTGENRYFPSPETAGNGTDWFDQIMQTGFAQNHQLSVNGGSERVKYAISGNLLDHTGVILGGDFSRGSFRANTDIKVNDWVSVGANLNYSATNTNGSGENTNMQAGGGTINAAIKMSPTIPVYDINGNYNQNNFPGAQGIENPVANAKEVTNNTLKDLLLGTVYMNISPLEGLNYKISMSGDIRKTKAMYYKSTKTISGALVGGDAAIDNSNANHYVFDNILTYKKKFGIHKFDVLGGYSREWQTSESAGMTGTGFPSDEIFWNNMASAEQYGRPTSWKTGWQLESLFGRLNYNLNEKYLVSFTGRYDGSSKLANGQQWAFFPSGAVAWRLSEENIIKDNLEQVSTLKLRGSYGLSGNSNIGLYRSQVKLAVGGYPFGDNVHTAVYPNSMGNPDLGWEYTTTTNIGFDLGLWADRLVLNVDAYQQHTNDLLWNKKLDPMSGYTSVMVNGGEIENKGLELGATAVISTKTLGWTVSGNISWNRNKLLALDDEANQWKVGHPLGIMRGKQYLGIFRDMDEILEYTNANGELIMPTARPGDVKYGDVGGAFDEDGNRIPDGKISGEDWTILGNPNPDFIFSINNDFTYRGFTLSVYIYGSQGNEILNRTGGYLTQVTNMRNNLSRRVLDRWTPQNPDADFMRMGGIGTMPNVEDGSYIRLQNVNLAYNFKTENWKHINMLRVFVSGQNLYTWTNYSGFDPDVNSGGNGIDNSSYPVPRAYTMGMSLSF